MGLDWSLGICMWATCKFSSGQDKERNLLRPFMATGARLGLFFSSYSLAALIPAQEKR